MPPSLYIEIGDEGCILQIGIILAVWLKCGMKLAVDKELQAIAVRENGCVLARPARRRLPQVPVEVGNNHCMHCRAHLRLVKRGAELRDSKDISNTGVLHAFIRVVWAAVLKAAPCYHAAKARIGACPVVRLRMIDSLSGLQCGIAATTVKIAESAAVITVLTHCF